MIALRSVLLLCFSFIVCICSISVSDVFSSSGAGKKILVKTAKPQTMEMYDIYRVLGSCRSTLSKDIHSKVSGTVTKITKNEGDFVKKGEVILSINYDNYELIAPFDGWIGTINLNVNDDIKAQDFLVSIISGDDKDIMLNIPERVLKFINKSSELYIKDRDGKDLASEIKSISPYLDSLGNSLVKARVASDKLIHRSFINGELRYNKHKCLAVPEFAVLRSSKGDYIYVKDENNRAKQVSVIIGSRLNDFIEIKGQDVNQNLDVVVQGLTMIYESALLDDEVASDVAKASDNKISSSK